MKGRMDKHNVHVHVGTDYTVQQRSTDQLHTHPLHTYTCKELLIEHMQSAFLSYTFSGSVYNYTHMIHSIHTHDTQRTSKRKTPTGLLLLC